MSLIDACFNQVQKKFLQDQPTKDWIKPLDLSPKLHHAPRLKEDVNEDSELHWEQDETSRLTQTHHHRQDRHLNTDSKHCHHLLCQDKTESLNCMNSELRRDWISANIGRVRYDSLKILRYERNNLSILIRKLIKEENKRKTNFRLRDFRLTALRREWLDDAISLLHAETLFCLSYRNSLITTSLLGAPSKMG
jgi:hypothetical protein